MKLRILGLLSKLIARRGTAVKIGSADWLDRWLDRAVPDQTFYFELVRALYSTPKSIFSATIAALTIIGISGALRGDAIYSVFLAGFVIVGVLRTGMIFLYQRTRHDPKDALSIKRWELGAL